VPKKVLGHGVARARSALPLFSSSAHEPCRPLMLHTWVGCDAQDAATPRYAAAAAEDVGVLMERLEKDHSFL
jgi:hypothetical protein